RCACRVRSPREFPVGRAVSRSGGSSRRKGSEPCQPARSSRARVCKPGAEYIPRQRQHYVIDSMLAKAVDAFPQPPALGLRQRPPQPSFEDLRTCKMATLLACLLLHRCNHTVVLLLERSSDLVVGHRGVEERLDLDGSDETSVGDRCAGIERLPLASA